MEDLIFWLDVVLLVIDSLVISIYRDFLFDFLIGQRNRKSARKIRQAQPRKERITLSFILGHLTRYKKEFRFYQRIYMGELYSLVPQYLIVLVCNFLLWERSLYVTGGFAVFKILLLLVVRLQTDSSHRSVYRRGK